MKYEGSCHCGAIGYQFSTALEPADWSIRACQCRFCTTHAALSCSDPNGSIEYFFDDPSALQRYQFHLNTADFLLCRRCGVYIGAEFTSEAGRFGIFNTRTLNNAPQGLPAAQPISYDGEEKGGRMSRREDKWTPVGQTGG